MNTAQNSTQNSQQSQINSGFGKHTSAQQALGGVDLSGKIAIVTGGHSGLGLETTRALAEAGAHVIVASRSPDKARAALAGIPRVEQGVLDLLDPTSITRFAQNFVASGRPLHILVNNAGIMALPLQHDSRGYELHFAANHLGHFQLTAGLLPALRSAGNAGGARVVSVSSRGHHFSGVSLEDTHFQHREYDKWKAYGQSKTANILFALELDKRGARHGIRAFSLHPGRILDTDLKRYLSDEDLRTMGVLDEEGQLINAERYKTPNQGAATSVWCAANPQLQGLGGVYCEDADIAHAVAADSKEDFGVKPWAIDPGFAERLWSISEQQTGITFTL
ncbi:oxidoreductase [Undibacterium terreum]|uniref:Probable oxidoreductase n=1 Tax=Undibacterium terreum TaxID=1224302 RepID=A0A916UAL2_9BURK|nr:oxidoreductase [Undibacterium terreum]GGC66420.1 oxidoreductase [Undibacterium terreum]